jgi:hypothetical protein
MAFRDGNKEPAPWKQCRDSGVAPIATDPMDLDLARHDEGEPKEWWSHLSSAQQYSLQAFAYSMESIYGNP